MGEMKGTGEGGGVQPELNGSLCSMVSCREILVQGQSGCQAALWGSDIRTKRRWGNTYKSTSSDNLNLQANRQRMRLEYEALRVGASQTSSSAVLIKLFILKGVIYVVGARYHIKVLFNILHI